MSSNLWATTVFLACLYQWYNFFLNKSYHKHKYFSNMLWSRHESSEIYFKMWLFTQHPFKLFYNWWLEFSITDFNMYKDAGGEAKRTRKVPGLQTASISHSSCSAVSITNQNGTCTYTHRSLTILTGYELRWLPLPPANILFLVIGKSLLKLEGKGWWTLNCVPSSQKNSWGTETIKCLVSPEHHNRRKDKHTTGKF